ncbi:MAG: methyltransferase domain-containing protein [Candidatus Zapsychrus exili]|nr:methyltransferase domain-containing protein [Candidatus Zapsychrus exili]
MKNIVVSDEYNELDLKPSELIEQYAQMVEEDVANFFVNSGKLVECACPLCGAKIHKDSFKKFKMQYKECDCCKALYISPRPDDKIIKEFYVNSNSRKFWQEKLLKATNETRKEKILKPRFEWIADSTKEFLPDAIHWADINTNQYGYIGEMLNIDFPKEKILINPFIKEENIRDQSKVSILMDENWSEKLEGQVDIVSLFEVIDRTSDLNALMKNIDKALKPGGLIFITSILSSGFDIKELWDQSDNIYPPDRLNVSSINGLNILFKRFGLECLEFSTPGILDLEIVLSAIKNNSDVSISRFARELAESKDENMKLAFQEFLQANRLSSYGRILLKKKG